ncbi:MAG: response regulator transcription factor [Terriglobales bacterium]
MMATAAQAKRPVRVVIADDHPIMRDGLRQLLQDQLDIELLGEAESGYEALRMVRKSRADVLVLDTDMPGCSAIEVMRQLNGSETNVILFSSGTPKELVFEALSRFARSGGQERAA